MFMAAIQRGSARADFPGCIADEADGILSTIGAAKVTTALLFLCGRRPESQRFFRKESPL
jgi:hypothetical protein